MRNAKQELVDKVSDSTVAFGHIMIWGGYHNPPRVDIKFNSHEEYLKALDSLNIEYDNRYGGQELFGTVVFAGGSWLERGEYDGSEWWEYKRTPTKEEVMQEFAY